MKLADGNKPIKIGDKSFIYKGVYNPIYWVGKEPYRPRVETLVIKDCRYVYVDLDDNIDLVPSDLRYKHYSLPGGSLDADSSKINQAEAEVNEEALVKVTLMYHSGITYYQLYKPGFILNGGDTPLEYVGSISDVYVGVYDGPYDKSLVDPKDLDPKMAEHGKFYEISKIAKYLRKEHIDALIQSQFVANDVKANLRLGRNDIINESESSIVEGADIVIPDGLLYHASIYEIDEFKPMSLDLGNYDTEPGWSTFCFDNYDYAKVYGLLRAIQSWAKNANIEINPVFNKGHILFTKEDFDKYESELYTNHKFFVYTIYVNDIDDAKIGVGNDASLREYTFRASGIKPQSIDVLNLSLYDIKELVDVVDDIEIEQDNEYKKLLNHEYNEETIVRDALRKAIDDGKLKPGDDVVKYMEDNGLSFKNDDISLPDIVCDIDEPVLENLNTILTDIMETKYPLDCYGLPDRKAYPMPDEKHVRSAIKFFNYAKEDEEKELAKNINSKIKEFNIKDIEVGDKNRFKKYYNPITESYSLEDYCKALESLNTNIESETDQSKKYALLEQLKNVIRLMVSNIDSDKYENIISASYNTLAEINERQISIIGNSYSDLKSLSFKNVIESVLNPVMEADNDKKNNKDNDDNEDDETESDEEENEDDEENTDEEDEENTDEEDEENTDDNDDTEDDDNEDSATDYEAMVDDEDNLDEDATDYEAMGGDDEPVEEPEPSSTTTDEPVENDTPDDTSMDTGDDGGIEDDSTDYEDMAGDLDTGDDSGTDEEPTEDTDEDSDSEDDTSDEDSEEDNSESEETDENNKRYDNKELKNFFLLNNFLSIHETVVDVLDSVNGMILPTPNANSIMAKVVKNLQTIKTFIEKFIQFQFSETDYAFNLYYYNILTNALRLNLKLLEEAVKIGEAKSKKKKNNIKED